MSYAYNCNIPDSNGETFYGGGDGQGLLAKSGTLGGLFSPPQTVLFCEVQGDVADPTNPVETDSPATNGIYMWPEPAGAVNTMQMATGYLGGRGDFMVTWFGNTVTGNYLTTGVHTGGSNYCLADGHVKWLLGNNVSDGYQQQAQDDTGAYVYGPTYNQDTWQAAGTLVTQWAATFSPI